MKDKDGRHAAMKYRS